MFHLLWAVPLAFSIGFIAAGFFYRLGVRDALLGLPHPRELVKQAVDAIRDGNDPLHQSTLYPVQDDEEYGK